MQKDSEKIYQIHGGRILIFGDMHFSGTYEGQHVSYISECIFNMKRIREIVEEKKPSAVFFLGDVIGVRERNIKDRRFFREVLLFFMDLCKVTKVFSVKGNHDFGDYSDFDLLLGLGFLRNPDVVDYYGEDGSPQVRFHFVNYGYEKKSLSFSSESGFSNVVLCHADMQIPGVTTWYRSKGGYELPTMTNWRGVDLVIAGHIHTPSTEFAYTTIEGSSVGLFYPGSPSRVAERFDDCWYMEFEYNSGEHSVNYEASLFGLHPAKDVFRDSEEFISDENVSDEEIRTQSLISIVKEVMEGRIMSGNLFDQIMRLPSASDNAKRIACEYLRRAIDEER